MTGKTGKENILFNFFNDFLQVDKKLSNLEKKDCFQNNRGHAVKCYWSVDVTSVLQLSDIGQLTSSCIISDLGGEEQPIKIQYFNIGNNNKICVPFSALPFILLSNIKICVHFQPYPPYYSPILRSVYLFKPYPSYYSPISRFVYLIQRCSLYYSPVSRFVYIVQPYPSYYSPISRLVYIVQPYSSYYSPISRFMYIFQPYPLITLQCQDLCTFSALPFMLLSNIKICIPLSALTFSLPLSGHPQ